MHDQDITGFDQEIDAEQQRNLYLQKRRRLRLTPLRQGEVKRREQIFSLRCGPHAFVRPSPCGLVVRRHAGKDARVERAIGPLDEGVRAVDFGKVVKLNPRGRRGGRGWGRHDGF